MGQTGELALKRKETCESRNCCGLGHNHGQDHTHSQPDARRAESCGCTDVDPDDESCGCGHDHAHGASFTMDRSMVLRLVRFASGLLAYAAALAAPLPPNMVLPAFVLAYLLFGYDIVLSALRNLAKGKVFDENFLMSVSTVGAFAIGEYPEAVAVMLFFQAGEFLQDMAVGKSRKAIKDLMNIKAEYANLKTANGIETVSPEAVSVGDIILVKPGEKVPLDGRILSGFSQLDTSSLTGESMPCAAAPGDGVLSGSINVQSVLEIQVTNTYENSTVAKMLALVENAASRKAPTERFITKFSRVYTPVVVFAAIALALIPPLVIPGAAFSDWFGRALVFLVVSCPCALVVSVPLTFFSGIGAASQAGILLKGSNTLQTLSQLHAVVFDKTGTLTKGVFAVSDVIPAEGVSESELLQTAVGLEQFSNHLIAKSVQRHCKALGIAPPSGVTGLSELGGHGLSANIGGLTALAGNARLMDANRITIPSVETAGTAVYVAKDGRLLGHLIIADTVKPDSAEAVAKLREQGVSQVVMVSGDRKNAAEQLAGSVGITDVYAECLPDEKVSVVESIYAENPGAKVAFVGDGINDAPVLARSDVGVAMGGVGSDAAVEAADVVIMNDMPSKVAEAVAISKNTIKIVKQNIAFALGVKFIVLLLATFGYANMWMAVFADVGVTLLVVIHAMKKKSTS